MAFKEQDENLLKLVSSTLQGKTVSEEKDPNDPGTEEIFPGHRASERPDVKGVHHKVVMEVSKTVRNDKGHLVSAPLGNHVIAEQYIPRTADESYDAFSHKVMHHIENSVNRYDEDEDKHTGMGGFSPYSDLNEMEAEEGSILGGNWMHAGAANPTPTAFYVNKVGNYGPQSGPEADAGNIEYHIHHYVKLDKQK